MGGGLDLRDGGGSWAEPCSPTWRNAARTATIRCSSVSPSRAPNLPPQLQSANGRIRAPPAPAAARPARHLQTLQSGTATLCRRPSEEPRAERGPAGHRRPTPRQARIRPAHPPGRQLRVQRACLGVIAAGRSHLRAAAANSGAAGHQRRTESAASPRIRTQHAWASRLRRAAQDQAATPGRAWGGGRPCLRRPPSRRPRPATAAGEPRRHGHTGRSSPSTRSTGRGEPAAAPSRPGAAAGAAARAQAPQALRRALLPPVRRHQDAPVAGGPPRTQDAVQRLRVSTPRRAPPGGGALISGHGRLPRTFSAVTQPPDAHRPIAASLPRRVKWGRRMRAMGEGRKASASSGSRRGGTATPPQQALAPWSPPQEEGTFSGQRPPSQRQKAASSLSYGAALERLAHMTEEARSAVSGRALAPGRGRGGGGTAAAALRGSSDQVAQSPWARACAAPQGRPMRVAAVKAIRRAVEIDLGVEEADIQVLLKAAPGVHTPQAPGPRPPARTPRGVPTPPPQPTPSTGASPSPPGLSDHAPSCRAPRRCRGGRRAHGQRRGDCVEPRGADARGAQRQLDGLRRPAPGAPPPSRRSACAWWGGKGQGEGERGQRPPHV